jgi:hypothetical protein
MPTSSLRTVGVGGRPAFPRLLLVGQFEGHAVTLGGGLEDSVDHARSDGRVLEELGELGDLADSHWPTGQPAINPEYVGRALRRIAGKAGVRP